MELHLKLDDYVKDLTKRFIYVLETPKDSRKQRRIKEPWSNRWFGMIPMAISMFIRRKRR
ncbi:MAG: YqzE family protein [Bacilli bacterium]